MSWRNSKAFELLTVRLLGLVGVGTVIGMGFLVIAKQNNEFGPRIPHVR